MRIYKLSIILLLLNTAACAQMVKPLPVEPGVSQQLAGYRKKVISNVYYRMSFKIPDVKSKPVTGGVVIEFELSSAEQDLQIDFKHDANFITELQFLVNTSYQKIPVLINNEHIIIDKKYLHTGSNGVAISFIAGDASLNRNDDYLYSLSVPDRARTIFPCFDQPDMKARFSLMLNVPKGWWVLANGKTELRSPREEKDGTFNFFFDDTEKLPTYLFSFTAGKYTSVIKNVGRRPAEFLYRETDSTKIKLSVDSVFKAHADAITFLENWTGIAFPFQKVGFVAIPDFQFGGMEHPGEVQYKSSALFLDDGATKDQLIARANVISHETAHMWFGDLVTMQWFNDVWMKEVFANFMADKVAEKLQGSEAFNQKFLQDHYPAAYGVDRTQGANPIRQQLDNLQDAGSLYGNIIYHKAPVMMRQLEKLMGKENFQKGIREYLKKYAYGNATWDDLIAILSKYSKTNLYTWNKVWVNQPGRPVFNYAVNYKGNKINSFTINQRPEAGANRIWPQMFTVALHYPAYTKNIAVNMDNQTINLASVNGLPKPLYIVFNADGMGYGLFPTDKDIARSLFAIKSPLERASAYIAAYENMLAGRSFKPEELLTLLAGGLTAEKDEMNLRLISGYITGIYWGFISPPGRPAYTARLEKQLWTAMEQQTPANNKKILFKAYQDIYLSPEADNRITVIWKDQRAPASVKLTEDDYISLALTIALKSNTVTNVLQEQHDRITNIERKNRLTFLMPALSSDPKERDDFFISLAERKNRQKEAWVNTALAYLNHPLRQNTSIKYLPKSLELVEEIQRTGDVFFPQSWLGAVLGSYQDKAALQIVSDFLKKHPGYNPKLKAKILQSADNLYRAQTILHL
ncbi:M1 family aminopeptidase [Mucilaginibacter sp. UR6-11]|uniref:M1 family aminopeptidase n=1 Tax=Mucilaginibacter sp. UR6-11 TaxID=1435644 RepID=UPI001E36228A|nr:M1 family aminopeptidase [Mucilaginibacter sp. UR6-11]MCC8426513.1 M1 family aminopeptidase [Mucilaginibacter sp. UR6-11]